MSHLRLTTSSGPGPDAGTGAAPGGPALGGPPGPGAMRFASFTPMNDQPGLADRKATFVIAAGGLLLTTTLFLVMPLGQLLRPGLLPAASLVLACGLACVVLFAMHTAYRCHVLPTPARPGNPLFFQNVADAAAADYAGAVVASTAREALLDVLDYNHTMAKLGAAKYRLVGRALRCLRVAIPLWVLLLIATALRGA